MLVRKDLPFTNPGRLGWLFSTWCVLPLEVVCSITLLPASSRQCRVRNVAFAISPKLHLCHSSSSYIFPSSSASIGDSPLGKQIYCSETPSWDVVPLGNNPAVWTYIFSALLISSSWSWHLHDFLLFLPILFSTECFLFLFLFPQRCVTYMVVGLSCVLQWVCFGAGKGSLCLPQGSLSLLPQMLPMWWAAPWCLHP